MLIDEEALLGERLCELRDVTRAPGEEPEPVTEQLTDDQRAAAQVMDLSARLLAVAHAAYERRRDEQLLEATVAARRALDELAALLDRR